MYLHLGQDTVVDTSQIVGIFDLDNSTVSKHTRAFLTQAQKENRVVNVSMELPKSFIVCTDGATETVYLSQLAPVTLLKRSRQSPGLCPDPPGTPSLDPARGPLCL